MGGGSHQHRTAAHRVADQRDREEAWPIVWEHGRRNFALRADGLVSIILPVADDGDWRDFPGDTLRG